MKRIYFLLVILLAILILGVSGFFYWFKRETSPVSSSSEKVSVTIERGLSASGVGNRLYEKRLIKNKLAFKIYVQFLDKTQNINAGEFDLSPSMSVSEIVSILGRGAKELWVTIPEGLRKEEVVERIIKALEIEGERGDNFRSEFLTLSEDAEGYLFPDTYLFPREVTAKTVYQKLTNTFSEKYESSVLPYAGESKFSKKEIVIMASILERETKGLDERPIVAGILWKRIESDWPLQVDATVQYALASQQPTAYSQQSKNWWPQLTFDDLEIDSPYNTYKYKGLPPSPIGSPGLISLKAAASPQPSDYWFYIHAPDGQIYYAKDSAEHSANVRKYLGKD